METSIATISSSLLTRHLRPSVYPLPFTPSQLSKKEHTSDARYSYGWQRAEILGALVNGVFLLALCFSIFMEAIERFVNVTEVKNPKLVIIVGSLGLASNIVGLFLFHDHGHSHGGHSHSHGGGGHSHGAGAVESGHDHDHEHDHAGHTHGKPQAAREIAVKAPKKSNPSSTAASGGDGILSSSHNSNHGRKDSASSLYGHPAQTRAYVVQTAQDMGYERQGRPLQIQGGERDRLLSGSSSSSATAAGNGYGSTVSASSDRDVEAGTTTRRTSGGGLFGRNNTVNEEGDDDELELPTAETAISHRLPGSRGKKTKSSDGHGHSHGGHDGEMNMRGVFLHVLGDALGNVGVIAAGVFIMLTSYSWRFYSDPLISFIITIIIFHSALPLVKSASFILLQGVPSSIPLEVVRADMTKVEGVLSVHELHVWQLSESKIVASVHVLVDCSTGQEQRYMDIAGEIRQILHAWGIHSSTIQPEFVTGGIKEAARISGVEVSDANETDEQGRLKTKDGRVVEHELSKNPSSCLLACGDDSCAEAACCPPPRDSSSKPASQHTHDEDSHDHSHDGHSH